MPGYEQGNYADRQYADQQYEDQGGNQSQVVTAGAHPAISGLTSVLWLNAPDVSGYAFQGRIGDANSLAVAFLYDAVGLIAVNGANVAGVTFEARLVGSPAPIVLPVGVAYPQCNLDYSSLTVSGEYTGFFLIKGTDGKTSSVPNVSAARFHLWDAP